MVGGVAIPLGSFLEQDLQDGIALAPTFGIQALAVFLHDQAITRIDFAPFAFEFVDVFDRNACAIAQLKDQLAGRATLIGPEQQHPGRVVAAQTASAGQRLERVLLELLLAQFPGVVGQNHPGIRIHRLANSIHALRQEIQHGTVVVLATSIPAIEHIADRVDGNDVGRQAAKRIRNGGNHLLQTGIVEHHAQLRRGDEIDSGVEQAMGRQLNFLHPFAQVVVLHLGLQVKDPQGARRPHSQERRSGSHVRQPRQQEITFAHLGRSTKHEQTTRSQHAW